MDPDIPLGSFEQIVLLAALRLADNAYGVAILEEISKHTGRTPSPGALYTTLHRMEGKNLITYREGVPAAERGGRSKRFVVVTKRGLSALTSAQAAYQSLLRGLDLVAPITRKLNQGAANA